MQAQSGMLLCFAGAKPEGEMLEKIEKMEKADEEMNNPYLKKKAGVATLPDPGEFKLDFFSMWKGTSTSSGVATLATLPATAPTAPPIAIATIIFMVLTYAEYPTLGVSHTSVHSDWPPEAGLI